MTSLNLFCLLYTNTIPSNDGYVSGRSRLINLLASLIIFVAIITMLIYWHYFAVWMFGRLVKVYEAP